MNKILAGALALSMISSLAIADNKYFSGGIALEQIEDTDSDGFAAELSAGIVSDSNFGAEVKLSKSIAKSEAVDTNNYKAELDVSTISLFGTYSFFVSPKITIMPKIGLTYLRLKVDENDNGTIASNNDSSIDISFGMDAKYNITQKTSLYVGLTIYNPKYFDVNFDARHFFVGIQQRF